MPPYAPVVLAVPTADLPAAATFYRDGMGFPFANDVPDGQLPEPVVFAVNEGLHLMVIPTGGFGWVTGDHEVAEPGTSECLLSVGCSTPGEVDLFVRRGTVAGGRLVSPPGDKPWGYAGSVADLDGHLWMAQVTPQA